MRRKALWCSLPSYQAKQTQPSQRRKPVRARSKAMEKRMVVYREKREAFLKANPVCAVFPWLFGAQTLRKATEVHHLRGRHGKLLLDERYWLAVSRQGHEWIGANPEAARRKGYLCAKGHWGCQD